MMHKNRKCLLCLGFLILTGCQSVDHVQKAKSEITQREGSLVFVRPGRFSILGTESVRDYIEIVYEEMTTDDRGFSHVTVGVRNVGGRHWYDTKGPSVQIGAEIAFYKTKGMDSAPIYRSNRRSILIQRGETSHVSFDCPVIGAASYQIVFSDY